MGSVRTSIKPTVAVIGYGSQGRAFAQNLLDSGWPVVVGLRPRSKSASKARKDDMRSISSISNAVRQSSIVVFAFPDHQHEKVYLKHIFPNLKSGQTLVFLSGMSVHFGFVRPPRSCDVVMLAPHAPGVALREKFLSDRLVSAFVAIHQDKSKKAMRTVSMLAEGIGIAKSRLVKSTFEWEAIGDLFGEQAVLCGGMASLILAGFDTLVEAGIPAEHAYLEVAYQLDLIIDLIKKYGIEGMLRKISVAARYGSIETGPKIINASARKRMKRVLIDIRSGRFPRKLNTLTETDIKNLNMSVKQMSNRSFERAAKKYSGK